VQGARSELQGGGGELQIASTASGLVIADTVLVAIAEDSEATIAPAADLPGFEEHTGVAAAHDDVFGDAGGYRFTIRSEWGQGD